jgi:hypothetical protein
MRQAASNSAAIDFFAPFADAVVNDYSSYVFQLEGLMPDTGSVFIIQVSEDGATLVSTGLHWQIGTYVAGGVFNAYGNISLGGATNWIQNDTGLSPYRGVTGYVGFNPGTVGSAANGVKLFNFQTTWSVIGQTFGGGGDLSFPFIRGVRFGFSAGLIYGGVITLYGLRNGA